MIWAIVKPYFIDSYNILIHTMVFLVTKKVLSTYERDNTATHRNSRILTPPPPKKKILKLTVHDFISYHICKNK